MNPAPEVGMFTADIGSTALMSAYGVHAKVVNAYRAATSLNFSPDNLTAILAAAKISRNLAGVAANAAIVDANSTNSHVVATPKRLINATNAIVAAANASILAANNTLFAIVDVVNIAKSIAASPTTCNEAVATFSNVANGALIAAFNAHISARNIHTAVINLRTFLIKESNQTFHAGPITNIFHFPAVTLNASNALVVAATSIRAVTIDNTTLDASAFAAINAAVDAVNASHAAFVRTVEVLIKTSDALIENPDALKASKSRAQLALNIYGNNKLTYPIIFRPCAN